MARPGEKCGEAPTAQSLQWLQTIFDLISHGQKQYEALLLGVSGEDPGFIFPTFADGMLIENATVTVSDYRTVDGKQQSVPESSWEYTGLVYVQITLSDLTHRVWSYPVGAINNRDAGYIIRGIHRQSDTPIIMANTNAIRSLRAIS
jgi:hypothetical protein